MQFAVIQAVCIRFNVGLVSQKLLYQTAFKSCLCKPKLFNINVLHRGYKKTGRSGQHHHKSEWFWKAEVTIFGRGLGLSLVAPSNEYILVLNANHVFCIKLV